MRKWRFLLGLLILAGCGRTTPESPTAGPASVAPLVTTAPLPPTFTPPATAVPLPTLAPRPTLTPIPSATPIDFDQTVVELRYTIPAIGLDRRLQGNVASRIIVVDETTGESRQFNNQGGVLLQLQQTLPDLTLESAPSGCISCVQITFNLPMSGLSGAGWLQDPILLASIENFMSIRLGPHFPPGTQLGLRRGVSPYAPAHTLVLTANGRLYRWLATDTQIPEPVDAATVSPNLTALLDNLPLDSLETGYSVDCPGTAVETLLIYPDKPLIRLICPEFALPDTLLPLYLALDELLVPAIADVSLPRPPAAFPLAALLDYQRADAARLTLYQDGTAVAIDAAANPYTDTITAAQIISLTAGLLDGGQLQPGLTTFEPTATAVPTATVTAPAPISRLLVRGPDGVYDGQWTGIPDFEALNALLDSLLTPVLDEAEGTIPAPTTAPAP
ncbi:MAG: hypothetical protein GY803_03365 [Chloroflexi bacterium]|nr:hypothetical protein [Chloroflexota bacterium]